MRTISTHDGACTLHAAPVDTPMPTQGPCGCFRRGCTQGRPGPRVALLLESRGSRESSQQTDARLHGRQS